MNIPRMCAYAGCYRPAIDGTSYCAEHQGEQRARDARKAERNKVNMQKLHDSWRQDGRHKLYNTARWRTMRDAWLKEHPRCFNCGSDVRPQVHHIVAHEGRENWFYCSDNFMTLCASCHRAKTQAEARYRKAERGV
jgi:5-methylcytosine-specific restriction endonuclease McrA